MHTVRTLLLTALALPLLTGQGRGPSGPPKLQVLIITGQNGHDWKGTTPVLRKELEDTGRFEVRINSEIRGAGPETFSALRCRGCELLRTRAGATSLGRSRRQRPGRLVRSGKGLVIYHFSLAAFNGWTEYEKMSAGNWRPGHGHHSARHDFSVDIKDADHPVLAGMKTPLPVLNEELYSNLKWQPEGTYHVLATAYDDHSRYDEHASDARNKQPMSGAGVNEPIPGPPNMARAACL